MTIRISACLGKLLSLLSLIVLASGLTAAQAQSTSVGGGTLSWTVTSSSGKCGQWGTFTYTQWVFSSFKFAYGGSNYSLSGSAVYFQDNNSTIGCPPNGPEPSVLPISLPPNIDNGAIIDFTAGYGGSGSAVLSTPPPALPTFTVSPPVISSAVTSGDLTLTGSNLSNSAGLTSILPGSLLLSATPTYISPTQINLYYTLTCGAAGADTITVTTTAGSGSGSVNITSQAPAPAISPGGISPWEVAAGSSGYLSIYGENLQNCEGNTGVSINASGVTFIPVDITPTWIYVYYSIPPNETEGTYLVTVTTTGGSSYVYLTIN